MKITTKRLFSQRAGRMVMAVAMLFATVMPALVPSLAMAAQVTERSIQLSNASVSSQNVTYKVNFTSVASAGAFVVDFCSNSPVVGEACTAPAGFDVGTPTSATPGFTDVAEVADDANNNTVRVTGTIGAAATVSVDIAGITNPSAAGPLYARIVTFDNATNADLYTSAGVEEGTGGATDSGGVAMSITPTIGVSGAVLESLTFCVSKSAIDANCTNTDAPTIALGETAGDGVALVPTAVSEGTMNTQISTNAVGGAVVRLKSNATDCGGLLRAGALTACDIGPANADISAGEAEFGVKTATATATTGVSDAMGTLQPADSSAYNNTTFTLNYVAGNATGITSVFGDPFLDTNDNPVNNQNMELTFGASISNSTPAGSYSATLSMIATGKF